MELRLLLGMSLTLGLRLLNVAVAHYVDCLNSC